MKYETLNEEMAADPELIPELMEYEQEYNHQGVNRPERDYIRWIQRSLNQILGLRLPVNGVPDPYTRSAVRGFQLRKGLRQWDWLSRKPRLKLSGADRPVFRQRVKR